MKFVSRIAEVCLGASYLQQMDCCVEPCAAILRAVLSRRSAIYVERKYCNYCENPVKTDLLVSKQDWKTRQEYGDGSYV